jgi:hypothetical protein
MNMRKRLASLIVASAALLSPLALAAPAEATLEGLLLGEHQNLDSPRFYANSERNLRGFSDETSSIRNESPVAWVLFDDREFEDRRYCIRPGEQVDDLHDRTWRFGDKTSSIMRLTSASCAGFPAFFG